MKTDVFYWLLNMSIHGSLVLLAVLALRKIPKLPCGFRYILWSLPALRLIMPFAIRGQFNLMALLEKLGTRRITLTPTQSNTFLGMANSVTAADSYFPITYESNVLSNLFSVASTVWAIVAIACMITAAILFFFIQRELRNTTIQDDYHLSPKVSVPILCGILHPKIILPHGVSEQELPYILLHERIHISRQDNLWRCFAVLLCCLHWFNPLCWLSLQYFFADMELSCDEAVIRHFDTQQRKEYAMALLNTNQQQTLFLSAFGGAKIRLRIARILSYKKLTLTSTLVLVVFFAAIAMVLITN